MTLINAGDQDSALYWFFLGTSSKTVDFLESIILQDWLNFQ